MCLTGAYNYVIAILLFRWDTRETHNTSFPAHGRRLYVCPLTGDATYAPERLPPARENADTHLNYNLLPSSVLANPFL